MTGAFVCFFLVLGILPDGYIHLFFLKKRKWVTKFLLWLPECLSISLLLWGFLSGHRYSNEAQWVTLAFILFSPAKFFFMLFSLLGKGLGVFSQRLKRVFHQIGIGFSFILFGAVLYGMIWGWQRIVVNEYEIHSPKLPASFNGYTFVHISDLHIGTYAYAPKMIGKITQKINALSPDVVFFTGDLINLSPKEIIPFLSKRPVPSSNGTHPIESDDTSLEIKGTILSVMGNHDYCEYISRDTPQDTIQKNCNRVKELEKDLSWRLLLNEHVFLVREKDSIAVIGVEDNAKHKDFQRQNLPQAIEGLPTNMYKILLMHDPKGWRKKVLPYTDIDLTLSGHTHAMQVEICGLSPARFLHKEWGGMYEEGEQKLFVSSGLGGNFPFRLGAWAEINVFHLYSE